MSNSTPSSKVYSITGANRGIGLGLVKTLKNEGIVFAATRNPELNALAKENKNIHVYSSMLLLNEMLNKLLRKSRKLLTK